MLKHLMLGSSNQCHIKHKIHVLKLNYQGVEMKEAMRDGCWIYIVTAYNQTTIKEIMKMKIKKMISIVENKGS